MDVSSIASNTAAQSAQQVQGGHHHHHRSMSQRVDDMESAIDKAVQNGKLTSDQATQMTNQLDAIKTTLANAQTSGTALTSDQTQQIGKELQAIGKQLFTAIGPAQGTTSTSSLNATDLFSKIDTDGSGSINQQEFSNFINQVNSNGLASFMTPSTYTSQGSLAAAAQSTISLTA